ncbi:MAG: hypothetical protein LBQ15_06300 [Clostridium sp.]|jgi:hypothetical protein|nr:hypothetical protein [Clostridium sp.]
MAELIRNAADGWKSFLESGKYPVLLMGVLFYLWLTEEQRSFGKPLQRQRERWLRRFAFLTAALVGCPLTAAPLLLYQTRFYAYEWLWSLVPLTLVIAYGATAAYADVYERYWKGKIAEPCLGAALGLAVLLLCSNPYGWEDVGGPEENFQKEEDIQKLLDDLIKEGNHLTICLWAPREVMERARAHSGAIGLPYGRNVWEAALNAYSYDTYDAETMELYLWMEKASTPESGGEALPSPPLEKALELGVNRILLPEGASEEAGRELLEAARRLSAGSGLEILEEEGRPAGYRVFDLVNRSAGADKGA